MNMEMKKVKLLELPELGDERGNLVVVEGRQSIPFDPKRVFYIYGSDNNVVRGKHANRVSEFVLINVSGQSKVKVDDGLGNVQVYELNKPRNGIYLPELVWKEMYDFSNDSVLLCLASTHFDNTEYIRDYEEFRKIVNRLR